MIPAVCHHRLSAEQVLAATHQAQRLVILAGPGTGKTHVIANRIVHQVQQRGMKPEQVLALTFTERAADTLRRRVAALAGSETLGHDCALHTFHSFAVNLLRTYCLEAGLAAGFRVCTPIEEHVFLQNHLNLLNAPEEYRHPRAISQLLRVFWSIQELNISRERLSESTPMISNMFGSFQQLKRNASFLSFPDIIDQTTSLLAKRPDIAAMVTAAYRHVLVDEFQDVNPALLNFLASVTNSSDVQTTIVGDDDQSIFGFRGASEASLQAFQQNYPDSTLVQLTNSFRCPEEIIRASQRLISHNQNRFMMNSKRKEMVSACDNTQQSNIDLLSHTNIESSAKAIAKTIKDFVQETQLSYDDVCVLARNNMECSKLAQLLIDEDLPVFVFGGGLGHAATLQTLISFLRAITQPNDSRALFNVLSSKAYEFTPIELATLMEGFDITSVDVSDQGSLWQRVEQAATSCTNISLQQQCQQIVNDFTLYRSSAIENGIRHLASDLASRLSINDACMEMFYERVSHIESVAQTNNALFIVPYLTKLASHGDKYWDNMTPIRPESPHITIMTVHKAKGTEFPLVVLCIHPDRKRQRLQPIVKLPVSVLTPDTIFDPVEEERRLVYVALTRATKRFVFASVARSSSQISRFVSETMGMAPSINNRSISRFIP